MDYKTIREIPEDLDFSKPNSRLENYIDLYIDTRKASRNGMYKIRTAKPKEFAAREHLAAMCDNRLLILLHLANKAKCVPLYERILKKITLGVGDEVAKDMQQKVEEPGSGVLFEPLAPKH